MMLLYNFLLLFFLPAAALFLTRRKKVSQMILWTLLAEGIGLLVRFILDPIVRCLSWGLSLPDAMTFFSSWYGNSLFLFILALIGSSILFTVLILLFATIYRAKKRHK